MQASGFTNHVKELDRMGGEKVNYLCDPPTPYIAYLRQESKSTVKNHVVYELGASDELRMRCVPYRNDACWRDFMGDEHVASMLDPLMMEVSEDLMAKEGLKGMAGRWASKVMEGIRTHHARYPGSQAPHHTTPRHDTLHHMTPPCEALAHLAPP